MTNTPAGSLTVEVCNARINRFLALQEEFHVILLDGKGELEALNRKGHLLGVVEESQHIDLTHHRLNTPLQLAHTLLSSRVMFNNELDHFTMEGDLFKQAHLL